MPSSHISYKDLYQTLASAFSLHQDEISLDTLSIRIRNSTFISQNNQVLPDKSRTHPETPALSGYTISKSLVETEETIEQLLSQSDQEINTNQHFRYSLFMPDHVEKADKLTILFHGLNEKHWEKYLPWAARLVHQTGQSVLLFPIAFHMNRAPGSWSNPRYMKKVSEWRKQNFTAISKSTFANAAMSTRLQHAPQRLFWSGLQSYRDVIQLLQHIRQDDHPHICSSARINLFGYSIGSLLSQILVMSNPDGLFDDTRLFIFCGGPTLDRMEPVSKYIMDSEANIALYAYYFQRLEKELQRNDRLARHFEENREAATYFRSLLNYYHFQHHREERFYDLKDQIAGVGLLKDHVVPPYEMVNTLQGAQRKIAIPIYIEDFPYPYSHMNPFPIRTAIQDQVNEHFNKIFDLAADHLA